jgi:hypothetical protein
VSRNAGWYLIQTGGEGERGGEGEGEASEKRGKRTRGRRRGGGEKKMAKKRKKGREREDVESQSVCGVKRHGDTVFIHTASVWRKAIWRHRIHTQPPPNNDTPLLVSTAFIHSFIQFRVNTLLVLKLRAPVPTTREPAVDAGSPVVPRAVEAVSEEISKDPLAKDLHSFILLLHPARHVRVVVEFVQSIQSRHQRGNDAAHLGAGEEEGEEYLC